MNVVMIIPTGIGAEIGGHAGDGTAVARLLGGVSETLFLHPNVVNASDINEMPYNSLYIEGSILDRFLQGEVSLKRVKGNRILVAVNKPVRSETINAVSAARVTLGAHVELMEIDSFFEMRARINEDGRAGGSYLGLDSLVAQLEGYHFDALALSTLISVSEGVALRYFREGGVNPWGGIEAIVSKELARRLNKPVAHAPIETEDVEVKSFSEVVDPRMSAEVVSNCYLHCVLKGLHKAPRVRTRAMKCGELTVDDVDILVSPMGCVGPPHWACMEAGIPIIAVRENVTICNDPIPSSFIVVENYLEAVGVIVAMEGGISLDSVRRPLYPTRVFRGNGRVRHI